MTQRSLIAFDHLIKAQEKFEYFMLGVIGALCAYLSQAIQPAPLGFNPSTLELLSLVVLIASAVTGFLRLEGSLQILKSTHNQLHHGERLGNLTENFNGSLLWNNQTGEVLSAKQAAIEIAALKAGLPLLEKEARKLNRKLALLYHARNLLLLAGFVLLASAKIWAKVHQAPRVGRVRRFRRQMCIA